jgi:DNA-binding response OmpR family regulator
MQKTVTILVIDDDITIRTLLQSTLTNKGFKVISAENGRKGLELAKAQDDIDIILLDWMMPEMDGIEVLTELKHDRDTEDIPVIMLTSKEKGGDVELANSKGAVDYIIKPFKLFEVSEMVQKHLDRINQSSHSSKSGFFGGIFSKH